MLLRGSTGLAPALAAIKFYPPLSDCPLFDEVDARPSLSIV
jgi:hypothetical protein